MEGRRRGQHAARYPWFQVYHWRLKFKLLQSPYSRNMEDPENTDALLEELSNVLTQLAENPHDLSLLAGIVRISLSPGMHDQLESGLEMATSLWPVGDGVWLPLIEYKLGLETARSPEGVLEILELFERAEGDYLCT